MEELKAMFPVCHHIKPDGIRCNSPAMKARNFCFNHIGEKPAASVRAKATTPYKTNLNLVHPGTREAIQHNIFLVAEAMNNGKIDSSTANSYIRLYRIAEQNLTRWEKANKDNPERQMLPLLEEAIESPSHEPSPIVIPTETGAPAIGVPVNRSSFTGGTDRSSSVGSEASEASTVEEPAFHETYSAGPLNRSSSGAQASEHDLSEDNSSKNSGAPAPDTVPAPGESTLNEALAARHAAHVGRPLNESEREYFDLPPARYAIHETNIATGPSKTLDS